MAQRPTEKIRKLEAVKADHSATAGEKAAAEAAVTRIRTRVKRDEAAKQKAAIEKGGAMYLLGRAVNRIRRGDEPPSDGKGVMHALGRALRKATKKK